MGDRDGYASVVTYPLPDGGWAADAWRGDRYVQMFTAATSTDARNGALELLAAAKELPQGPVSTGPMRLTIKLEPSFDGGGLYAGLISHNESTPITCRLHFVDLPGAGRCMVVCGSQTAVRETERAVQANSNGEAQP